MANKLFLAVSITFLISVRVYPAGSVSFPQNVNSQTPFSDSFVIPNQLVSPDTVLQVETSIAVHPLNPMFMAGIVVTDIYPGGYTTGAYITTNGGLNWSGTHSIRDSTGSIIITVGNPKVVIDKNGTIMISFIASSHFTGGRDGKVGVSYTTNNGLYWSRTVYIPGIDTADKSVCATDDVPSSPYFGRSYVVYNERRGIYFASTTNGGKNWTVAKQISPLVYYIRTGAYVAVGQSGEIYVTWPYLKETQKYIGFARSTNGGATWDSSDTAIPVNPIKGDFRINLNLVKLNGLPSITVDNSGGPRNGWIYIIACERIGAVSPALDSCDVTLRVSTNKGVTWPLKYRVNQDAPSNMYNVFPALDIDKSGGINVVYFDTRNTPSRDTFEVFVSRSVNGGQTFKDTLVSDHKFKLKQPVPAKWLFGIPSYIGTGIEICSSNNKIIPMWYDNFMADEYQAWVASIEVTPLSSVEVIPQGFYNSAPSSLNSRDTVKIYLRNPQTPYVITDSSYGILDSLTFKTQLYFKNTSAGEYYIEVCHRNSINTWSKQPVTYTMAAGLNYNFTDEVTKAFGDNMVLKGSKWCIYSGDVYKDGVIDPADLAIIDNDAANFTTGYTGSDINGDKVVDSSDMLIADNNAMNFVLMIAP